MAEDPNGDAEEVQSADAKRAGQGLRFLAWFLLVLTIITIIAAIAILILRHQRIKTNESRTIANIITITGAQWCFSTNGNSPCAHNLTDLTDKTNGPACLSGEWYDGVEKHGYIFNLQDIEEMYCYALTAVPAKPGSTGTKYFFSDGSGVIRLNEGGPADSTCTPFHMSDREWYFFKKKWIDK